MSKVSKYLNPKYLKRKIILITRIFVESSTLISGNKVIVSKIAKHFSIFPSLLLSVYKSRFSSHRIKHFKMYITECIFPVIAISKVNIINSVVHILPKYLFFYTHTQIFVTKHILSENRII